MKTKRTVKKIGDGTAGSEIAAETSAAMAASSIVFRPKDRKYARSLLNKAKLVRSCAYIIYICMKYLSLLNKLLGCMQIL